MDTSAQESHMAGGSCNGQCRTKQPIRVECLWLCHFVSLMMKPKTLADSNVQAFTAIAYLLPNSQSSVKKSPLTSFKKTVSNTLPTANPRVCIAHRPVLGGSRRAVGRCVLSSGSSWWTHHSPAELVPLQGSLSWASGPCWWQGRRLLTGLWLWREGVTRS